MYKIIEEKTYKYSIERSKFLSFVYNCDSTKKQSEILNEIRSNHLSANHICYASSFFDGRDILYYFSDDGEPSGTAGLQIQNALKENDLVDCLCVVVRYFGGIKLGVPGLSRAYKSSALQVLNNNKKICEKKYLYEICCTYEQYDVINKLFLKEEIKPQKIDFQNSINLEVALSASEYEKCLKIVNNIKQICEKPFYI